MSPRRLAFTCLALSVFISGASGTVIRDDVPDYYYRKLGKQASFAPVGRVDIDYGKGYQPVGTATLYGPDRLVSAAHVFDGESLAGAIGVRVNFGRGKIAQIDFATPGVVNINPGFNRQTLQNDISVIFLPAAFSSKVAKLYTGRRVSRNTVITFVGYGDTGNGRTGSSIYSITKRAGQNVLDAYVFGGNSFEVDFDRPGFPSYSSLGSSLPLALEGLIGPGDSGGSVWIRKGGKWRLIGINDYGLDSYPRDEGNGIENDYGDHSGFVYVPRYYSWMNSLTNPSF